VKCYQCSTGEDPDGKDLCGAYERFRTEEHVPVDCLQDESVTPGTFCVKIVKQGPIGFICKYFVSYMYTCIAIKYIEISYH